MKIPYARQHIDLDDLTAVSAVLFSEKLTGGAATVAFERDIANYCGARFAIAVSSATMGLQIACRTLDVGPDASVWTSPNSFLSSATCALHCGANVDFVDIDPETYNLSPEALGLKLDRARAAGELPKAIVAVHFSGRPCDLKEISFLARSHDISLIEDAAHALGATYEGRQIGACEYSELTVLSFQATKSITTGEGGMILTNDAALAHKARLLREMGTTRDPDLMSSSLETEPWKYEQIELGFNARMSELQAALGSSQLEKLRKFVARRTELAKRYDEALRGLNVQLPVWNHESTSAWHLYPIQLLGPGRQARRLQLYERLLRAGIRSQVHYIPIHTQPYFRGLGFRDGQFPAAEHYYGGALSLPLFYDLTDRDQDRVIEAARHALSEPAC